MKKIIILCGLLLIFTISFAETHIPPGNVSGIWTFPNSPYIIDGEINIPIDSTLIIEPGVQVLFSGHYKFYIYGRILAEGTETDTIVFTCQDTTIGWWGLRFHNTNPNGQNCSKIVWTKVEYVKPPEDNQNTKGGAIHCGNSDILIKNCLITHNTAGWGGGIYCAFSNPILTNVVISGNTASGSNGLGGGILCDSSNICLTNVIICENTADQYGGGIFSFRSNPILINVTMNGNFAGFGGGICCRKNSNPGLVNSILCNNSPQEIYFTSGSDPNSITITYSDVLGGEEGIVTNNNGTVNWLEGNIDADPLFADPQNGDFHLTWANFPIQDSTMSPCIDAGDPSSPLDPDSTRADMGAFYFDQSQQGVDDTKVLQTGYFLNQNYPNPFSTSTTISFFICHRGTENTLLNSKDLTGQAEIKIYNVKGQMVRKLGFRSPAGGSDFGFGEAIWDGKDENGKPLNSGIYFYKLKVGDKIIDTKKCLLLK